MRAMALPIRTSTQRIEMLRNWDGQMDQDRPEPFITTLVFQYMRKGMAERASPGSGRVYDAADLGLGGGRSGS